MIPIYSKEDSFALDQLTIASNYLSKAELMDNAGRSIAQFIIENIHNPFDQTIIVIVGPGKNGGDAIICHYYLIYYPKKN